MKKIIGMAFFLLTFGDLSLVWANELPASSPAPDSLLKLSGKVGFGTSSLPYNYSTGGFYVNTARALSVRNWLSDQTALELITTYNYYQGSSQDPNEILGAGLGFKFNLRQPVKGLFIQFLGQGSFCRYDARSTWSTQVSNYRTETWGLFTGLGFEFFIPYLDVISLEASIGVLGAVGSANANTRYNSGQPDTIIQSNGYAGNIFANGMSLNTLSVHFYL